MDTQLMHSRIRARLDAAHAANQPEQAAAWAALWDCAMSFYQKNQPRDPKEILEWFR